MNLVAMGMPQAFNSYKPRHMKVFGVICVNDRGEVLLVRGRSSNKWSFPKGHCKYKETDLECALRELKEETGLVLSGNYSSYHKLRGGGYFVFAIDGNPTLKIGDNWEIEDVAWFPLKELPAIHSNVDVSIFRTLMHGVHCEVGEMVDYIESPEAFRRVNTIKRRILPQNIPFSG